MTMDANHGPPCRVSATSKAGIAPELRPPQAAISADRAANEPEKAPPLREMPQPSSTAGRPLGRNSAAVARKICLHELYRFIARTALTTDAICRPPMFTEGPSCPS